MKVNPPKNKRTMKQLQQRDPVNPVHHKPGTKPARREKKFRAEMKRKKNI